MNWNKLAEIEHKLKTAKLPKQINLTPYLHITNVPEFVDAHLQMCHANKPNPHFIPYLIRLQMLLDKLAIDNDQLKKHESVSIRHRH